MRPGCQGVPMQAPLKCRRLTERLWRQARIRGEGVLPRIIRRDGRQSVDPGMVRPLSNAAACDDHPREVSRPRDKTQSGTTGDPHREATPWHVAAAWRAVFRRHNRARRARDFAIATVIVREPALSAIDVAQDDHGTSPDGKQKQPGHQPRGESMSAVTAPAPVQHGTRLGWRA